MKNRLILFFLLLGLFVVYEFHTILNVYFVQDDFFLLAVSKTKTIKDFFTFFTPRNDVVWYRPLSSQVFFFLMNKLFDLRPFGYHIVLLTTHYLNGVLLYFFSLILFKNKKGSLIASILYLTNASLAVSLAWLSTYSFILGVTFILLTLIFFLKYKFGYSFIFFSLGLLTTEITLLLIIPLIFLSKKKRSKKPFLAFLSITFVIILLRFILFPVNISANYSLVISFETISLIRFYSLRIFGLPMLLKLYLSDIFVWVLLISFLVTLGILTKTLISNIKQLVLKPYLLSLLIYIVFLLPFLFLPFHQAPYYLSFSLIGFSLLCGNLLIKFINSSDKRWLLFVFLVSYLTIQTISFSYTRKTHWIFTRAQLSKQLIDNKIYSAPVGTEEYFALGANRAVEVFEDE